MIQIKYINGVNQIVNVDGSFYVVSLVQKNGKPVKMSAIDKAVDLAHDLGITRGTEVSEVRLTHEFTDRVDKRFFKPVLEVYPQERQHITVRDEKKRYRKLFKNVPFVDKWKFTF